MCGGVCGSRGHAYTITDVGRQCTEEHSRAARQTSREAHVLLAVVVHSVPASSFTVFISITVNTLAVESLPLVSWTNSFKTFQLYTR